MARKTETGIEYFPINTDIILNPKIRLLIAEFGSKNTWPVLMPLYCKIFREKGYWIDWLNEDTKMLFALDECKVELSVVNEFVDGCIRRSLFNKGLFESFGILTSDRIQENYLIAKARNKEVNFIEEFAVKNEKNQFVYKLFNNVNIIGLNVNIITKKVYSGTQNKKEKESKIIEGEGEAQKPPVNTPEQIELFKNFERWILENAQNVGKMKEPFFIEQFLKLKDNFSSLQIRELILKMHNWKDLQKKNVSAYLTFLNWSRKDFNVGIEYKPKNQKLNLLAAINTIENGIAKKV